MNSRLKFCWLIVSLMLFNCQPLEEQPTNSSFLKVRNKEIVQPNGQPVLLQGVSFGNEVWSNPLPYTHHTEEDFVRVKDMGMNVIRFYMNYETFESDTNPYIYKDTGWAWLDQNIAWAKEHNIYLLLNMHVPQGGFQSIGGGDALWQNSENQNRLVALWKEIARRYSNEPIVAGFDLINEPQPTQSKDQLKNLMQRITDAIRVVDKNHLIVVERANAIAKSYSNDADLNFYLINDTNVLYTFHFYSPFEYTHQYASWVSMGDGGTYPDETRLSIGSGVSWHTASFNNPIINKSTTDWSYYEGVKYEITDSQIALGKIALVGEKINSEVYFDDFVVKEYDPNGNFVRDVWSLAPSAELTSYFWSANNSGSAGLSTTIGRTDQSSYFITNTTADANLSLESTRFIVKPGYSYQANGWMKGTGLNDFARAQVRLDFEKSTTPIFSRGKEALEAEINLYQAWADRNNVPVYLGEYGVISHCFENNKGGVVWVNDMLEILQRKNVHSTYHAYHEDNFGIYPGYGTLPDPATARTDLINVFKEKLKD
jgi:endoglucanase